MKSYAQYIYPTYVNTYYGVSSRQTLLYGRTLYSDNSPRVNGRLVLQPNTWKSECGIANSEPQDVARAAYNDARALNSAIEEFRKKIYFGAQAQFAVNLIQAKQATDLIKESCDLLLLMAHTVATRNVHGLKKFFNRDNWRGISRNFGKAWLQLRYGWLPTMGDIYTAVDVIQATYPTDFPVQVRKSLWIRGNYRISRSFATLTARVSIDSADLVKKHQLGLDNPAAILWELVPYSFVVDWFLPVGLFLDSIPGYPGVTVSGSSTTRGGICLRSGRFYSNRLGDWLYDIEATPSVLWDHRAGQGADDFGQYFVMTRNLGISPPQMQLRLDGLSTGRALNSIAMLTQFLKSRR